MLKPIDWILIALYIILIVVIGLIYRKRASKSIIDFFVSGRQLPWVIAGLSMVATTFAADTPLAVTELIRKNGISGNWLWWNMLIGGMLTTLFFAHLWRRAELVTEVELINFRYSGKAAYGLRLFKAIYLGLFMNSMIIAWVNLAMVSIVEVFFPELKQYVYWIVFGLMFLAALYSAVSGLWGVAITDAIQFVIAIGGSIILAIFVINKSEIQSITNLKQSLPQGALNFFPSFKASDGLQTFAITIGAFLAYIGFQWWASWYPGAEPGGGGYIAQRMMSTKSEKHSTYATLLFQISHYALRPWAWIVVGLATIVLYPQLSETNYRIGYVMAINDYLPNGLKGLLLVAFLAAYMSTISTQLNFGASLITNDFILPIVKTKSDRLNVIVAKITTLVLMLISIGITKIANSISEIWKFVLESGAGVGLVLILRWYWWRINAWSEIVAIIAAAIGYATAKFVLKLDFPNSYFFTIAFTTIAWLIATFITKPTDFQTLKQFYSKVKPGGWWKPIASQLPQIKVNVNFAFLFLSWISAILMGYGILFLIGAIIFKPINEIMIYLTMTLIGLIGFVYSYRRAIN